MEPGIAPPDQLSPLTSRVIRGINRLLCDPGLAPHHRVRLEIDLRHLSAIDLTDQARATVGLAACLPRVVDVVDTVSPLYLRLHTDLGDLMALVNTTDDDLDDEDRSLAEPAVAPAPVPTAPALLLGEPGTASTAAGSDLRADSGTASAPPSRGLAPLRLRVAVGLVGLAGPPLLLAARGLASDRPVTVLAAFALLCPTAVVVGLVSRALVHPEELPPPIHRLIARAPDRFSLLLGRAAASAWSTSHDEPVEG